MSWLSSTTFYMQRKGNIYCSATQTKWLQCPSSCKGWGKGESRNAVSRIMPDGGRKTIFELNRGAVKVWGVWGALESQAEHM